jgi:hypothetical protein
MAQLMESVVSGGGIGDPIRSPAIDIEETEDAWVVEAELPGVKCDDVNVEMRDSELIITGEIKERERCGVLRCRTRRVGRFDYRVACSRIRAVVKRRSPSEGAPIATVPAISYRMRPRSARPDGPE